MKEIAPTGSILSRTSSDVCDGDGVSIGFESCPIASSYASLKTTAYTSHSEVFDSVPSSEVVLEMDAMMTKGPPPPGLFSPSLNPFPSSSCPSIDQINDQSFAPLDNNNNDDNDNVNVNDGFDNEKMGVKQDEDTKALHLRIRSQSTTLVLKPGQLDEVLSREDETVFQDSNGELITVVTDSGMDTPQDEMINPRLMSTDDQNVTSNGVTDGVTDGVTNGMTDGTTDGTTDGESDLNQSHPLQSSTPMITHIKHTPTSSYSLHGGLGPDPSSIPTIHPIPSSSSSSFTSSHSVMNTECNSSMHVPHPPSNRIEMISFRNHNLFRQESCFTRHQAIEYWVQKKIVQSRGEGANLLHLLMALGIIEHRRNEKH